ncbi:MAG: hypothetical protein AABY22_34935 [Nanoarchaeota archaeon]
MLICDICNQEEAKYHLIENDMYAHLITNTCLFRDAIYVRAKTEKDKKLCNFCLVNQKLANMNLRIYPERL